MNTNFVKIYLVAVLTILQSTFLFAQTSQSSDWEQFRGNDRSGVSTETGILQKWSADGPELVWKKDIDAGTPGGTASDDQIQIQWDGRNMFGRLVGNGMYAIKIMAKPKISGGSHKALQYIGIAK